MSEELSRAGKHQPRADWAEFGGPSCIGHCVMEEEAV